MHQSQYVVLLLYVATTVVGYDVQHKIWRLLVQGVGTKEFWWQIDGNESSPES